MNYVASNLLGLLRSIFGISSSSGAVTIKGAAGNSNDSPILQCLSRLSDNRQSAFLGDNGISAFCKLIIDSSGGTTLSASTGELSVGNSQILVTAAEVIAWNNSTGVAGTKDIGLGRVAAGVLDVLGGTSGDGWIRNRAGEAALASAFTNNTATPANTNLSITVKAGRSYPFQARLIVSNTVAGEGCQFDFNGGAATATLFDVSVDTINGTNTPGTTVATSLAGAMNFSSLTGVTRITLSGFLKCANGGTLIIRFAENSTSTGTATLAAGSYLRLFDSVPL